MPCTRARDFVGDDAGGRLLCRAPNTNCAAGFPLADVLALLPDPAASVETWAGKPRLIEVAMGTLEFGAVEQV